MTNWFKSFICMGVSIGIDPSVTPLGWVAWLIAAGFLIAGWVYGYRAYSVEKGQ